MAIKIIKSTDKIIINTLVMVIYGQPGVGKSSFGFTAENPLLLDFDKGAYRSKQRKDTLDISSWKDIIELMRTPDVMADYKTIVVDTTGRCLDFLTQYIIAESPKFGNKNGNLTMQGWGELKILFTQWLKQLRMLGKDIILVAHEREDKEGDNTRKRPDMQGGSYAELLKVADLIGYLSMENNRASINFTPCDAFYAKNAANIQTQYIPSYVDVPNFAAKLLSFAKAELSSMSEDSTKVTKAVIEWTDTLEGMTTLAEINQIYKGVRSIDDNAIKAQVIAVFTNRVNKLGFEYDKELKEFIQKPTQQQPANVVAATPPPPQKIAPPPKAAPPKKTIAPQPMKPVEQASPAPKATAPALQSDMWFDEDEGE